MFAIVNNGIRVELVSQPTVECQIAMGRHKGRVMIGRLGIDVITTGGLNTDNDVSKFQKWKMERLLADEGISFRSAPLRGYCLLYFGR